ncbi:MAG: hypothetical protein J0M19_16925 [Sphingomonadales bacterium]|nr:hypothetical protein [Sphingomonadales bacterium]
MAADSPQVFALRLHELIEKAKESPEQVVRKVGLDIAESLIEKSPVGDPTLWKNDPPPGYVGGRFKANWNCAFGRIDTLTTPSTDKGGEKTKNRIRIQLNGWQGGQDIFLTNSLPYAIPLEYGHSKQAPLGMVRLTVTQFQTFIDKAVREVRTQ